MWGFTLRDAKTKLAAKVSKLGELVVGPLDYNDTSFQELAADDTGYNFYPPRHGKQFVIKGMWAKADQQTSNTVNATVIIYEASSPTSTVVDRVVWQMAMLRGDLFPMGDMNLLINEGKWLNAKTGDDDIHMNIYGHYVPAFREVF